jgi:5-methylcytosine-specific restriction endonuclease McrA
MCKKSEPIRCDCCGQSFHRSPANRLRKGAGQYCSRACMATAFTGRESARKGVWITKPCEQCGKLHSRPAWAYKYRAHVFCNSTCFGSWKRTHWRGVNNPCWRGGVDRYYGPNWDRQARRARARDKKRCQFCTCPVSRAGRNLDVHHIRPFRFYGHAEYRKANLLTNLVSLCPSCHHFLEKLCQKGTVTDWPTLRLLGMNRRKKRGLSPLPAWPR